MLIYHITTAFVAYIHTLVFVVPPIPRVTPTTSRTLEGPLGRGAAVVRDITRGLALTTQGPVNLEPHLVVLMLHTSCYVRQFMNNCVPNTESHADKGFRNLNFTITVGHTHTGLLVVECKPGVLYPNSLHSSEIHIIKKPLFLIFKEFTRNVKEILVVLVGRHFNTPYPETPKDSSHTL